MCCSQIPNRTGGGLERSKGVRLSSLSSGNQNVSAQPAGTFCAGPLSNSGSISLPDGPLTCTATLKKSRRGGAHLADRGASSTLVDVFGAELRSVCSPCCALLCISAVPAQWFHHHLAPRAIFGAGGCFCTTLASSLDDVLSPAVQGLHCCRARSICSCSTDLAGFLPC